MGALRDQAAAQAVEEQRPRQPVLERAGRVRRLVLEIEVDAGQGRDRHGVQVRVGGARLVGLELADRLDHPAALGVPRLIHLHQASEPPWTERATVGPWSSKMSYADGGWFVAMPTGRSTPRSWTGCSTTRSAPRARASAQGSEFLVLDEPDDVALFWTATSPDPDAHNAWLDGMRTAPGRHRADVGQERLLGSATPSPTRHAPSKRSGRSPTGTSTPAMAALLILQTAVDEGLGACFFGVPREHVRRLPGRLRHTRRTSSPIGAITVGHRLDDTGSPGSPARRERRTDVVHRGRYST